MAAHYPVFLDLHGRLCAVVGGGAAGARKVGGLLEAGARVVLIAPEATEDLQRLCDGGRILWRNRSFEAGDLSGCFLAIAATDRADVNRAVRDAAQTYGVLFCAADAGAQSDFVTPAVLRRGDLQVAISTGGGSPAYARMLRDDLAEHLGPEHTIFLVFLKGLRPRVMARFPDAPERRMAVWRTLVTRDVLALVRDGHWDRIEERVTACLS